MHAPRVQPPPLTERGPDGVRRCPLDRGVVQELFWPGSTLPWFSCPDCQAYWSPSDARDGRTGRWDDSGDVCVASTVRMEDGAPVVLDCVLGDDHVDGRGEPAVHVSVDLVSWSDGTHHRAAA